MARRDLLGWRVLFVVVLILCLYSGLRSESLPQIFRHFDLVMHFGVFALLAVLCIFSFRSPWSYVGICLLVALAAGIEVLQGLLLQHRTASVADFCAGFAGVFVGGVFALLWRRYGR